MHRARVLGSLAASLALVVCACPSRHMPPKCVEPPTPTAEDFAACGGMHYHAGPGPNVDYTIKVTSELPLQSACVIVDDYSLFAGEKHEWSGSLFKGKHVVKVQAVVSNGTNTFTIRSASELASLEKGTIEIVIDKVPAVHWKGAKCE